ncbi:hypothetical protein [Polaromonas naphthalenivorans]|uniref:Uncharacterized protein n=1 Tax=Polaromonas naphthalenivorans (strain CJ2) TaxID=365044 RepID=A1VPI5_POLNA|nr:hypothetical protein [Polaromonas naphthalenivorans]ABM37563.1 conserved hypothetical protein [Polaromonas naphthalenivorans CJ2]
MTHSNIMLQLYLDAEAAVLAGKTIQFAGRTHTMESLDMIQKGRREWEAKVTAEATRAAGVPTFGGLRYKTARFN